MLLIRKLARMDRSYTHFKRYVEIVDALFGFGLEHVADSIKATRRKHQWCWRRFRGQSCRIELPLSNAERMRLLLESLGPTFVKLGQVLSSRPDLVSHEMIAELVKLQDRVPGFPWEEAQKIIEDELKRPIDELFCSIEHEPFAAASIGQVHRAVTRDGQDVVVKVQRPGIERKIKIDLEILYHLAERLEKSDPEMAVLRPSGIVEEFSHVLTRELNYIVEATHARRFADDMAEQPGIRPMKVYDDLSALRVITMGFVPGTAANIVVKSDELRARFDLVKIAHHGADAVMAQIFEHGFFHADPHGGNILLADDGMLTFIDFGMMGRVTEEERDDFIRVVQSILRKDHQRLTHAIMHLAEPGENRPDLTLLERDLGDLVEENLFLPLDKLSLARILEQLMQVMRRHQLTLRPNLFVMFKALMTIEQLARDCDPKLRILEILESSMRKAGRKRFNLRRLYYKAENAAEDVYTLLADLPSVAHSLVEKVDEGNLSVKLQHQGLDPLRDTIQHAFNRLAYAVVLASLIIGSSLIVLAKIPPHWRDIPILGIFGYIFAALLGFGMLLRSMRNKT